MAIKKLLKAAKDAAQREAEPPKAPPVHDEGWLVSYADMMTLLCGFFIMMFSMANMDPPKYEQVAEAMSTQFGGEFKSPAQEIAKVVKEVVQDAGIEGQATIKVEGLGVTVAFMSTLFFDTLSAEVKPDGYKVLQKLAEQLYASQAKETRGDYQVVVEGHTDSRPVLAGGFPSNWELSGARASRVVRFFLDQRFKPDHLTAIGYADTRPEVDARGPDGSLNEELLGKNRRVVVRILSGKADSIPMPKLPGAETAQAAPAAAHAAASTPPAQAPVQAQAPGAAAPAAVPAQPPAARAPANAPATPAH